MLVWYNLKLKAKSNEIEKASINASNQTKYLIKAMDKIPTKKQNELGFINFRKINQNIGKYNFKFKKPQTKEKLKFELQQMLIREDPYANYEASNKPSTTKNCLNKINIGKLKKIQGYHNNNKQSNTLKSINKENLYKSNSTPSLPHFKDKIVNLSHCSKFNALSPSTLNKFKIKGVNNKSYCPSSTTQLFLNYTKHTKKINLNRDKLSKVEEDIRKHANRSITGLNWFSMEYD